MLYKFIFYFLSFVNKKCDVTGSGGTDESCYWAGSAVVGMMISLIPYDILYCLGLTLVPDLGKFLVRTRLMDYICIFASVGSFLYFRNGDKWIRVYEEISSFSMAKKIKYGVLCLLYIVLVFGLFFLCNDVIRELMTQGGPEHAEYIVEQLGLTYW